MGDAWGEEKRLPNGKKKRGVSDRWGARFSKDRKSSWEKCCEGRLEVEKIIRRTNVC